jgi:hypothetical protein
MNTLFQINNNNEMIELIPILTLPFVASSVFQTIFNFLFLIQRTIAHIFIQCFNLNKEMLMHLIAALIAAEIVYIFTLVMEQGFNKVEQGIIKLKEEVKEKDKIIAHLLQKDL